MYFGLTRVLFAIAHDGLLPKFFAHVNPKSGTPIGSIAAAGVIMLAFSGFVPLGRLAELANIGTLGAFVVVRSEEHTSELQSLMRISYAFFCLKKNNNNNNSNQ